MGLLLLTFSATAGDDPTLQVTAPKQVVAGSSFTVNVEITKGELEGIARYQLSLPQGVTIEPGECANGDFEFTNQTLKLMWYRLPKVSTLKFSYKVITHPNIKGMLEIGGGFICINSANVTKSVSAPTSTVEISQSPKADPKMVVDIKDFKPKENVKEQTLAFIPATQQMQSVQMVSKALRQAPSFDAKNNCYLISILLDKGNATKYAKLEEEIPAGFTAEPLETSGAVFDFKNGKVKFLWLELPNTARFLVSYKLKPTGSSNSKPAISGYFAFINGETTEIHEVAQVQDDIKKFIVSSEMGSSQQQSAAREIPIKYVGIAKQSETSEPKDSKVKNTKETTTSEVKETKTNAAKATAKAAVTEATNTQKSEQKEEPTAKKLAEGVTFKVQLAAISKEADKAGAEAPFKAAFSALTKEEVNGLVRYLVGPFSSYNEAQTQKDIAKSKGFSDAFIAVYNKQGARISLKEAFISDKK